MVFLIGVFNIHKRSCLSRHYTVGTNLEDLQVSQLERHFLLSSRVENTRGKNPGAIWLP